MKITKVRTESLRRELDPPFDAAWDPVPRTKFEADVVIVETDEGITGIGGGAPMAGFGDFEHLFVGEDPFEVSRHSRVLETIQFHARAYWPLEAALWDIIGKACGQPVARLFGGSETRLPVYASCGELKSPVERAESALALREEGFRAMKIRVDPNRLEEGLAAVAATREAIGDSMEIMVDLNEAWRMAGDAGRSIDLPAARRIADALSELDVFWLEEPLPYSDPTGMKSLREHTGVRVAGGEMARNWEEVMGFVEAEVLDVYQPDVVLTLGMHRARFIAELAHAHNHYFTPHTWTDGLGLLANLHVTAGVGGGPYLEFPYDPPGWTPRRRDFMLAEPLTIDSDGCLPVPDAPGLGAALNPDLIPEG
ncbi:MAG: mandelate racemase/muconate lactonizing enzyme family protein [Rubrobacteraceae bacterium]